MVYPIEDEDLKKMIKQQIADAVGEDIRKCMQNYLKIFEDIRELWQPIEEWSPLSKKDTQFFEPTIYDFFAFKRIISGLEELSKLRIWGDSLKNEIFKVVDEYTWEIIQILQNVSENNCFGIQINEIVNRLEKLQRKFW